MLLQAPLSLCFSLLRIISDFLENLRSSLKCESRYSRGSGSDPLVVGGKPCQRLFLSQAPLHVQQLRSLLVFK